jgi:hypothetical protein
MRKILTFIAASFLVGGISSAYATTHSHKHVQKSATKEAVAEKGQSLDLNSLDLRTQQLTDQIKDLQGEVAKLKAKPEIINGKDYGNLFSTYAHGPAVVTSPLLSLTSAYDGSDLLVNLPSMNEDLYILQGRQSLEDYAKSKGLEMPVRPMLSISGGLEGQLIYNGNYNMPGKTDIDLSRAEVDFVAEIDRWVTGVMVVDYDNYALDFHNRRVHDARFRIDRGFFTVGNLNECPLYLTLGQVIAPFGKYAWLSINPPVTLSLARIKERALVLGFSKNGAYGSVYGYKGETYVNNNNIVNAWGVNLGYGKDWSHSSFDLGAGYVANIADAEGMLDTLNPNYPGFGRIPSSSSKLVHRVSGIDAHFSFTVDPFDFISEYVTANTNFDMRDMSFDGKGAKPSALNLMAKVRFDLLGKASQFLVGYDNTWQALAVNLPQQSYFAKFGISLLRATLISLELRHDRDYDTTHYYTSRGAVGVPDGTIFYPIGATAGKRDRNSVTMEVGVYF